MAIADYDDLFQTAANQYGIDPNLLKAHALVESSGDPDATSDAGAQGLMQLMPETAKSLGVKDPYDPAQAIPGAAKLIRENIDRYGGSLPAAIMAYHGGTRVSNWGPKTHDYLNKVTNAYQQLGAQGDQGDQGTKPMDDSFTSQQTGGDSTGLPPGYWLNPVTGLMESQYGGPSIPAPVTYHPPTPGSGTPNPAAGVPSGGSYGDTGNDNPADAMPAMGSQRFSSPLAPPQGLFGNMQEFSGSGGLPTGDITQDPAYAQIARQRMIAGLLSATPGTAGFSKAMSGMADTAQSRLDNAIALQRAQQMYGTQQERIATQLVRSGMPYSLAMKAAGFNIDPQTAAQMDQSQQYGKAMPPGAQKVEDQLTSSISSSRQDRAQIQHFIDMINSGQVNIDPVNKAIYGVRNALGQPSDGSAAWQQLQAMVNRVAQNAANNFHGPASDARYKAAQTMIDGGGLTSNEQALQHLDQLQNMMAMNEQYQRQAVDRNRQRNNRPGFDWEGFNASIPGSAPGSSPDEIARNIYGQNNVGTPGSRQTVGRQVTPTGVGWSIVQP